MSNSNIQTNDNRNDASTIEHVETEDSVCLRSEHNLLESEKIGQNIMSSRLNSALNQLHVNQPEYINSSTPVPNQLSVNIAYHPNHHNESISSLQNSYNTSIWNYDDSHMNSSALFESSQIHRLPSVDYRMEPPSLHHQFVEEITKRKYDEKNHVDESSSILPCYGINEAETPSFLPSGIWNTSMSQFMYSNLLDRIHQGEQNSNVHDPSRFNWRTDGTYTDSRCYFNALNSNLPQFLDYGTTNQYQCLNYRFTEDPLDTHQHQLHIQDTQPDSLVRSCQELEDDAKPCPHPLPAQYANPDIIHPTQSNDSDPEVALTESISLKPKRPLTAYNFFFKDERVKLIDEMNPPEPDDFVMTSNKSNKRWVTQPQRKKKAKIAFEEMAKTISKRWKSIDPAIKANYEETATLDRKRYHNEMDTYNKKKLVALSVAQQALERTVDDETRRRYLDEHEKKSTRKC